MVFWTTQLDSCLLIVKTVYQVLAVITSRAWCRWEVAGIYLQQHYIPIYKLISYKIAKKNFPNTEKYFEQSVSLPIHFDISVKDINKVVKEIKNFKLLNK